MRLTTEAVRRFTPSARSSDAASAPNLVIVDAGWSVVIASATDVWEAAGLHIEVGQAVPLALQTIVRSALASIDVGPAAAGWIRISPWPHITLTISTVRSVNERLLALSVQLFRARKNLRYAQQAYGLSPRELEILQHVLRGSGTAQIAVALSIANSTVIAHVKSLLTKTKAANRAALVARVLGWEEAL